MSAPHFRNLLEAIAAGGLGLALDATAAVMRAAILDPASYASGGYLLPGTGNARINASARASVAMQQRVDAAWEFTPHNLLLQSADLSNAAWLKSNATVAANRLTVVSNGSIGYAATTSLVSVSQGQRVTIRARVKAGNVSWVGLQGSDTVANSAGRYFNLSTGAAGVSGATLDGGTTFQAVGTSASTNADGTVDCSFTFQTTIATTTVAAVLVATADGTLSTTAGQYVDVSWVAMSYGTTVVAYVPTTAAAVYGPAIDWLAGIGVYGLRSEESRTNLALWSRDLTQAAWTKTNATPALTAIGIDGAANSASTLTATAANATALQAITNASVERTLTVFLRRRTGTGTVETTIDGGATWVPRTLTAAWQPFSTTATLANPNIGIRIVTNGDAVDVDAVQCETGAFATSPILTYSAAATRARDIPIIPYTIGTSGTVVAGIVRGSKLGTQYVLGTNVGVDSVFVGLNAAGNASSWDDLTTVLTSNAVAVAAVARMGVAWASGARSVCLAGGTVATGAHNGNLGSSSQIVFGADDGLSSASGQVWITSVRAAQRRFTDAELQAVTA